MLYLFLAALGVMTASLGGVIGLWRGAGVFIEKNLKFLVSLSAGVFLVVAAQIAWETFEHSGSAVAAGFWIAAGGLGTLGLFRLFPAFHHHHDEGAEAHPHSRLDIKRIIVGDAIHNVADGILLAGAFAVGPALGLVTATSIFFHELIQEISEFFVMKQAGYTIRRALVINFAVSATILVGAGGAFFLVERFVSFEAPLLGIAAGVFFLVVFFDLIPHSVRHSERPIQHLTHLLCFLLGVGLMAAVLGLTPHAHEVDAVSLEEEHNEGVMSSGQSVLE